MPDIRNIALRSSRILAVPLVEHGYRPDPVYLFLELNRRCNHRCIMCDIWKQPMDGLPLAEIQSIFSQPFFDNFERVILAGGEPTIRKDLVEIASFFVARMPRLRAMAILTNGYSTNKTVDSVHAILDRLDAVGKGQVLAVQISLDGIGDEYNQIRGIEKAWVRTHDTVLQLRKISLERPNLSLMLHVVMQPSNIDQLETIDAYARDLGIPILFSPAVISATYFGNANTEYPLEFDAQQKERVRSFILDRDEAYTDALPFYYKDIAQMLQGAQRSRRCMMGYYIMYVRMDGKVFPCINSGDAALGDLTSQSPVDLWRGAIADGARRTVRSNFCPTCPSACDNDFNSISEVIGKYGTKLRKAVLGVLSH
jgi:MoaA/NifB/PqqE/SkfB family radical SAM enzyme